MINFAMWKNALVNLQKVDKAQWDGLDVISKWFILTRAAVTTVTLFSCMIAGLFAWRAGQFEFLPWLIVTLGLFIAHGTNNILNDYTDYVRGVDTDNYFRTAYGAHPLVHKLHDKRTQLTYFVISGVLAVLTGIYALFYTQFDPWVIGLFAFGAFALLLYTWPLKHLALGELFIFLIWGPVMIGGVYYVLTRSFNWNVILASIPVGLSVASINIGKHIDKMLSDKERKVTTLPVFIGQTAARYLTMASIVLAYLIVLYLIFVPRFFTPLLLVIFFAGKLALIALSVLSKPRPDSPPEGYPAWPIWFSGFAFMHNRRFTLLLISGILVDTLVHVFGLAGWWA